MKSCSSIMARITKMILKLTFALSLSGTVSNTTNSVSADLDIRSVAGPERTPWEAKAKTLRAPASFSNPAAVHRVPAVSTISSTIRITKGHHTIGYCRDAFPSITLVYEKTFKPMIASHPSTEPTRSILSISLAFARCLTIMARPQSTSCFLDKASRNCFALQQGRSTCKLRYTIA